MLDTDSKVEALPNARKPESKRTLGHMGNEESVSITAPSPFKKGLRVVPRGAVGLRAAPAQPSVSEKAVATHGAIRQKVREGRDQHRQKVWDKLDLARQKADEKKPRLDKFSPRRDQAADRESPGADDAASGEGGEEPDGNEPASGR
jgi:hypothetical protein